MTFNAINKIPVLKFSDQKGNLRYLLLDTGASLSIIHQTCIPLPNIPHINTDEIVIITGISDKSIKTIGSYNISLYGLPCKFHIVQNDFAVKSVHGILGSDFLDENKVIINYEKKL